MTPLEILVEELEETLYALGTVPRCEFSGTVRGSTYIPELREDEILALCHQAHEVLTGRFALHLEWFDWPPREGRLAAPGTPLDFDTHRDFETTELSVPFLALVPDDQEEVVAVLAPGYSPLPAPRRTWWRRWLRR